MLSENSRVPSEGDEDLQLTRCVLLGEYIGREHAVDTSTAEESFVSLLRMQEEGPVLILPPQCDAAIARLNEYPTVREFYSWAMESGDKWSLLEDPISILASFGLLLLLHKGTEQPEAFYDKLAARCTSEEARILLANTTDYKADWDTLATSETLTNGVAILSIMEDTEVEIIRSRVQEDLYDVLGSGLIRLAYA